VPHGETFASLAPLAPVFASYVMSFVFLGIYWSNHHHMLQAAHRVNGQILWSNLYLLFWLSLVPFVTGWMGENHFAKWPVASYGFVLLMSAIAYYILARALVRCHGSNSALAAALGSDFKGKISIVLYVAAIAGSFWNRWIALGIYGLVSLMWLIPDRRFEKTLAQSNH
jgi:uncharacterized membrane protein